MNPAGATLFPADDRPGALADLAVPAPESLAGEVLVRVGLEDRMAPMASPVGTLWVAWNGRGVSEVELADDGPDAIARHEARSGRPTRIADALPATLARAIERRLAGERRVRIPLDLRGLRGGLGGDRPADAARAVAGGAGLIR